MSNDCTQMRRKLVKRGSLNTSTGETTMVSAEWVTEPCGSPLFGDQKTIGRCRGCVDGWTHPENYPVSP